MKATECRTWNLILFENQICYVTRITDHSTFGLLPFGSTLGIGYKQTKDCEGIPLTEEWITRFGFGRAIGGIWSNSFSSVSLYEVYDGSFALQFFSPCKIYYVHQLQNLYFALTGTELELK